MTPSDLDHSQLAVLGREYLLAGHLIDRAGMPALIGAYGREAMQEIAIEEWMGASPVYTERIRRLLGIDGHAVADIFKAMQFDIGAPHEFMDFRYEVQDEQHGEFWLVSCGALMDVEPMGDEFVHGMCHTIEDPTFDATAVATNPRARMRPIHRPPRVPADRAPHCYWTVDIDPTVDPVDAPTATAVIESTNAASTPIATAAAGRRDGGGAVDRDGWSDYCHPIESGLRLERFSPETLVRILDEVCLQGHLLAMSCGAAVERRYGRAAAVEVLGSQMVGVAGVTSGRLRQAFDISAGPSGVGAIFELHPMFAPRAYIETSVESDESGVELSLQGCAADSEAVASWGGVLALADDASLRTIDAIAKGVDPTARAEIVNGLVGETTWRITFGHEPEPEAPEVAVTRFSTGADFEFAPPDLP